MKYRPAVNTDPFAVPKTDMTTPRGIKKLAGPNTILAHSYFLKIKCHVIDVVIEEILYSNYDCDGVR